MPQPLFTRRSSDVEIRHHFSRGPLAGASMILRVDVTGPADGHTSRVIVRGDFWGGRAGSPLGAPSADERMACQHIVDDTARAIVHRLTTDISARFDGTQIA